MTFRRLVPLLIALAPFTADAQVVTSIPDVANGVNNNSFSNTVGSSASIAITGAQPRNGNGSLELQMTNFAQPAVYLNGTGFTGLLSQLSHLSFDFLGTNAVNTTPTIRVAFQATFNDVLRTFNLGWYRNSGAPTWENSGDLTDVASSDNGSTGFWLRLTGSGGGQVQRDCSTSGLSSSFDDRRQSLTDWLSNCNGAPGTFDLTNASVIGVQVDQGRWPGFEGTNVNYVDNISAQFGTQPQATINFETAVPEPSSLALMAVGMIGLVGVRNRRRI